MSKQVHFSVEQLEYMRLLVPRKHVTVDSSQADFIYNVLADEYHAKIDNMMSKLHNVRYKPVGRRYG